MAPSSLKRKLMGDSSGRKKRAPVAKRTKQRQKLSTSSSTSRSSMRMGMPPLILPTSRFGDSKPSVAAPPLPRRLKAESIIRRNEPIRELKAEAAAAAATEEPLTPKIEYSPNAMAKCTKCRKKIQKGHKRFGIPEKSFRFNREIYKYYHVNCCPKSLQALVPNAMEQLKQQKTAKEYKGHVVRERQELHDLLKRMRLLIANRLEVPAFMVLSNTTLEEIVFHMPANETELLKIYGIGPSKLQSFGDPILRLVYQYRQSTETRRATEAFIKRERKAAAAAASQSSRRAAAKQQPAAKSAAAAIVIDDSDDDDEIAVGKTLTCEELVNQKFEHAAANGYVISVD